MSLEKENTAGRWRKKNDIIIILKKKIREKKRKMALIVQTKAC
jgi:hypothetical protein